MSSDIPNETPDKTGIILYKKPDGRGEVQLMTRDGSVWLTQAQIADLFGTSKQTASQRALNILKEKELDKFSVVKHYLTTATDGKNYETVYYSLEMILAI